MAYYENNSFKNQLNDDMDYVDIHGRNIRVIISEKTGDILIPLNEVRQTGFNIYRRNQYNKALIDDRQLCREFEMYLLDCAKTYILKNKVIFDETQILQSIDKCRQALISNKNNNTLLNSSNDFFKNRIIQNNSEDTLQIQVKHDDKSSSLTQKNLHSHNKRFSSGGGGNVESNNLISLDKTSRKSSLHNKSFEQSNELQNQENSPKSLNNHYKNETRQQQFTLRSPKCNKEELLSFKSHNNSSSSSDNTPKPIYLYCTTILEKMKIHSMIVTFIESKGTIAWVQDVNNSEILVKIFNEVDEQAKKQSSVKPLLGEIYAALDEGHWYRCRVINLSPLTVLFIDYGNQVEVDEVRPISDDLIEIPQQAVRISFKNPSLKLEEEVDITPLKRYEDGTYNVHIKKRHNQEQRSPRQPVNQQKFDNNNEIIECFVLPEPLEHLSNNILVKIDRLRNNKLTLRTKNSYNLHKEIRAKLTNLNPEPLKRVKVNQIILYRNDTDDCFYRVRVLKDIDQDSIKIDYLDYYDEDIISKTSIFAITDELSKFRLAYVPIVKFENVIKQPLNSQQEQFINKHLNMTKFVVELNNDTFDLKYLNEDRQEMRLFDELNQFVPTIKRNDITILEDLQNTKLKLGKDQYMCSSLVGYNVTIIKDLERILQVMQTTVESDLPYEPEIDEVCLGLFEDNWFRCAIKSIENNQYHVHFVDFGNHCILQSNQLRKITDDMKDIPILGNQAKLVSLPDKFKTKLNEYFCEGDTYEIDVKCFNDGFYEIEIPEIYEQLLKV